MVYINLIYEDVLSQVVMERLLECFGDKYVINASYFGNGFGYLKRNIRGFNEASIHTAHFMLTDLDLYNCPVELRDEWIDFPLNQNFIFRIAVKEVEAWLLADILGLSNYMRIPRNIFPLNPEDVNDPKDFLIRLAKRSRLRRIREDIVPINDNAIIGPNYNGCLIEFVYNIWNIEMAKERSVSLKRTLHILEHFEFQRKINQF